MKSTKKILFVFGTRPEAIKLAPLIQATRADSDMHAVVCVLRQHGKMLDQVLRVFDIKPEYDLDVRINDKDLLGEGVNIFKKGFNALRTGFSLYRFLRVLKHEKPDMVVVHGDTSTAFLVAFIAFNYKMRIAHVEAGLRTYDKYRPFPEEMNRRLIDVLTDIYFAPTEAAKQHLLNEHVLEENIHLTGNTAIDALLQIVERQKAEKDQARLIERLKQEYGFAIDAQKKLLLVTAHRRESFGEGLKQICFALRDIAEKRDDVQIVYPVHLNPNVQKAVKETIAGNQRIELIEPVDYELFVFLMNRSHLILTDSGGIQEEAPSLGKPILVLREVTERPEGVEAGAAKVVGTSREGIVHEALSLLSNSEAYKKMAQAKNPYGDGKASEKIVEALRKFLN